MVLYPGFTAHFTELLSGEQFCLQFYCLFFSPLLLHCNNLMSIWLNLAIFLSMAIVALREQGKFNSNIFWRALYFFFANKFIIMPTRRRTEVLRYLCTLQVSVCHTGLFLNFLILKLTLKGRSCTTYFKLTNGANLTEISQKQGSFQFPKYLLSKNSP